MLSMKIHSESEFTKWAHYNVLVNLYQTSRSGIDLETSLSAKGWTQFRNTRLPHVGMESKQSRADRNSGVLVVIQFPGTKCTRLAFALAHAPLISDVSKTANPNGELG